MKIDRQYKERFCRTPPLKQINGESNFMNTKSEFITQTKLIDGIHGNSVMQLLNEVDKKEIDKYFDLRIREIGNPFTSQKMTLRKMILNDSNTVEYAKMWIDHIVKEWNRNLEHEVSENEQAFERLPFTKSYSEIFSNCAKSESISSEWLEQYLNDADTTMLSFSIDPLTEWKSKIPDLESFDFENKTVKDFFDFLFEKKQMTQSCGITANFIHATLSPTTEEKTPTNVALTDIGSKIYEANNASKLSYRHQYLHVEGGGHAFIIEIFDNKCCILQSFFGEYSLADDLLRNKSFEIGDFVNKIIAAYSPEINIYEQSRFDLFNSKEIDASNTLNIKSFSQEEGTRFRLEEQRAKNKEEWEKISNKKASSIFPGG